MGAGRGGGRASAGGEGRYLSTSQRFPAGANFTLPTLQTLRTRHPATPAPPALLLHWPQDPKPSGGAGQTQPGRPLPTRGPRSGCPAPPSRAPRPRARQGARCVTRPRPAPASRPPPAPPPAAPTYILPLDEFDALLETVGHAHGLELQRVHSRLSPGHQGSPGLRATRARAAGTGRGAQAPARLRGRSPPLRAGLPGLPASAPPPARLSSRGARGRGARPCPGGTRDVEPRRAESRRAVARAASRLRVQLLGPRRLPAPRSAHPPDSEGARE